MSAAPFKAACVQPSCGQDMATNIATVGDMVRDARDQGADFIAVPENAALMEHRPDVLMAQAAPLDSHPVIEQFAALAAETGAWLLVGSVPVVAPGNKIFNCSVLLDSSGKVRHHYNKIHLFDVDLPTGESYRESDSFAPGDAAVLAETPWGPVGMTICYDLRFASLYRSLAQAGAFCLTAPAAFTHFTGLAHWHVLVRARAIECGAFVIAPNMWGDHSGGRKTYGHSLIVDPWGEVLADAGEGTGVLVAEIDPARADEARARIPALQHDRVFGAA